LIEVSYIIELFDVQLNGLNAIVLWVFAASMMVFLFFQVLIFGRLIFYKEKPKKIEPDPVSVVIASRDDARMLREHLPMVMKQKGVTYEVIVVDDCSLDDTVDVLREYSQKYQNFKTSKLVESGDFEGGKKYAVTMGIKAARYPGIVFIDADCYPNSENWLKHMAEKLMLKRVVLGYGPYKKTKGFLNKLIRFDTYKIATQYLSFALWGIPYMGVGRNMAYHSFLYFDAKGFTSHLNVVSGDDDLFVNEVSNSKNTGIELQSESYVYSVAKEKYLKWEFQKRRHLTTAPKYKGSHQVLLLIMPLSQYILNISFLILLLLEFETNTVLGIYGVKVLLQGIVMAFNMKRLEVLDLLPWSIVLEPLLMLFYPWVTFLNIVKEDQRSRWI
jgi:glycosyltransferase involved in cell wall biosynthesis